MIKFQFEVLLINKIIAYLGMNNDVKSLECQQKPYFRFQLHSWLNLGKKVVNYCITFWIHFQLFPRGAKIRRGKEAGNHWSFPWTDIPFRRWNYHAAVEHTPQGRQVRQRKVVDGAVECWLIIFRCRLLPRLESWVNWNVTLKHDVSGEAKLEKLGERESEIIPLRSVWVNPKL